MIALELKEAWALFKQSVEDVAESSGVETIITRSVSEGCSVHNVAELIPH
jgi:hypothetical protein